jgi:RNA polymerase sigma factor (sigma-70 family)
VDYQRLLIDHLDLIRQIVRTTGRRRHLSATEREDFASFVNLRLVEDNYAILRKFQNRSKLRTYLIVVIDRLSLDFCAEAWGRWRHSAKAEKLGHVAVLLERLVARDGYSIEEAMEIARTHHDVELSFAAMRRLWDQLPLRMRTTEVGEEAAAGISTHESSDVTVEDAERRARVAQVQQVLRSAFEQIAAQDRVVIALSFDEELPIVEIAKLTGISVPTLHRRLNKSLKQLRASLTRSGLDRRDIADLIGHPSIALSPLLRAEVERFLGLVRLHKRDG